QPRRLAVERRRQRAALDLDDGRGHEGLGGDGVVDGAAGGGDQAGGGPQLPVPPHHADVLGQGEIGLPLRYGQGGGVDRELGLGRFFLQKKASLTTTTSPECRSMSGSFPARMRL